MSTEQEQGEWDQQAVLSDFDIDDIDDDLYLQLNKSQNAYLEHNEAKLNEAKDTQISILEQLLEERERVLNEHIQKLDKMIHQQANIMVEQKNTIIMQANIMFEQEMQSIIKDNTIQVQGEALLRCFSWRPQAPKSQKKSKTQLFIFYFFIFFLFFFIFFIDAYKRG